MIRCAFADFGKLQEALEARGITPLSAEHEYICTVPTELPEEQATEVLSAHRQARAGRGRAAAYSTRSLEVNEKLQSGVGTICPTSASSNPKRVMSSTRCGNQHPLQMIHLVLHDAGMETLHGALEELSVRIQAAVVQASD